MHLDQKSAEEACTCILSW